ncbi:DUF4367 domain-containing protein [Paenibacillus sp. p3-SID867]|uniref:DUF4367 domain-containing protein n=1 Tax=Paenibacillus sp. p3-SID867 TaxID=2916363 RepID=UPI0021A39A30|nr:DUF4367 domain-containing protein [Paenibacillus sp. p3-SID867]MCT1403315.1 DUF4367 domain-containing protein [Paenibacillus sp. p3-SID867]
MEVKRNDVEEKLIEQDPKSHYIIDVRDAVMERVACLPAKKPQPNMLRRPLVIAASLLLVTSLSVTVYAATELIQIRSKDGKVVLETKPKPEVSRDLQEKWDRLHSIDIPSSSLAWRSALPGQAIAYYIHNQEMNDMKKELYGKDTLLKFQTGPIYLGALKVLQEEATKRGMPNVEYPSRLLNEYSFSQGFLSFNPDLSDLFHDGEPTEVYYDIQNELIRQAEASTNNKKVFVKEIKPPSVSSISLSYIKGKEIESSITVFATKRSGMNPKQEIHFSEEDHVEKVLVKGHEMIYVKYADAYFNQGLAWVDEQHDLYYHISLNNKVALKKEEILEIAESLIN